MTTTLAAPTTSRPSKEWLEQQHYFSSTDQLLRELCLQLMDLNEKLENEYQHSTVASVMQKVFGMK